MKTLKHPHGVKSLHEEAAYSEIKAESLGVWLFAMMLPEEVNITQKILCERFSITRGELRNILVDLECHGYYAEGPKVFLERRRSNQRRLLKTGSQDLSAFPELQSKLLQLNEYSNNPELCRPPSKKLDSEMLRIYLVVTQYYTKKINIRSILKYEKSTLTKASKRDLNRTIHLSSLFLTKQQEHWPSFIKEITVEKILTGALQIYRLMSIDKYDYSEIKTVLKWLTENPEHFWSRQMLSLSNIRGKCSDDITRFDHLRMSRDEDMKRSNAPKKINVKEEPINKHTEKKAVELSLFFEKITGESADCNFIANRIYTFFNGLPDDAKNRFKPEGGYIGFFNAYMNYIKGRYGTWEGLSLNMLSPPDSLSWCKFVNQVQKKYRISFKTGRRK